MEFGEYAALAAAALWAFSSLLYTRVSLTAWQINTVKTVVASIVLAVQLFIVSQIEGTQFLNAPGWSWGWLAFSGLIGLVAGDTCYFRCLQILGVRRCLTITVTAPIFTAILGWAFLDEILAPVAISGVFVTVIGVAMVINDRTTKEDEPGLYPGSAGTGVMFGIGAAVCQAVGAVAAKHAMTQCDPLEATFGRLAPAAIVCIAIMAFRGQFTKTIKESLRKDVLKRLFPAVVCGAWLGVWLSQIAFKQIDAASAQTLLSTSPLFIIGLTWALSGKPPSKQVVIGAAVAVAGVTMIIR